MASIIVLLGSILLISVVGRLLGKEILSRRHIFGYGTTYNRTALKLERQYKILAFFTLEGLLFWALITSMIQLLAGEPF